jgi:hypothetical protein
VQQVAAPSASVPRSRHRPAFGYQFNPLAPQILGVFFP